MTRRLIRRALSTNPLRMETLEVRATPANFFPLPTTPDGDPGSLREAISQSNANAENDTIELISGIYSLTENGTGEDQNQSGDLDVINSGETLTIRGAGASATWIRADVIDRVLQVHNGARLVMQDLTITHGRAGGDNGGGIFNQGTVEMYRVEVLDNFGRFGGGIYNTGGMIVDGSTVSHNFAVDGGGIYNTGTLDAKNSTISTNNAGLISGAPRIQLTDVGGGFNRAVAIENAGDGSDRVFIVEQNGTIDILGSSSSTPFLDIRNRVLCCGERGLLGLAFHPEYGVAGAGGEGKFYVYYSASDQSARDHKSVISEFQVSTTNPDVADPSSERVLLEFDQPFSNHNGGDLKFGPDDGLLYISSGDGGSGNDPENHAQNLSDLLGTILRIDVDGTNGPGGEYGIPSDNPFVDVPGARDEIYAYGLRNPFRTSFDDGPLGPLSEDRLFVGDVGQSAREEIDLIVSGGNYGWRCYEGLLRTGNSCNPLPNPVEDPIADYIHEAQPNGIGISAIGGYVYRGNEYPELTGTYIFSDFSGEVFTLNEVSTGNGWDLQLANVTNGNPFQFTRAYGQDEAGELYLTTGGEVYQITTTANSEPQRGGGIFTTGSVMLEGVSIAANKASDNGGGVATSGGGQVIMYNTVIGDNEAPTRPDIDGSLNSNGFNLIEDPDGVSIGGTSNGLLTGVDPGLEDLADNGGATPTHALQGGSPAIGGGDPSLFLPFDQIGRMRSDPDIGAFEAPAAGATIQLGAVKDNTLFHDGSGTTSNGAGQYFFAGTIAQGGENLRRGLIAFDVASSIPAGATIVDATLSLNMSRTIAGSQPVSLHRTLADWGEGASNATGQEGTGTTAAAGDATWLHTFSPSSFWSSPGGDFSSIASATTQVGGNGNYDWTSAGMIADLQAWLDDPAANFGWTLIGNESTQTTAKRFDTREHPNSANRPSLSVTYTFGDSFAGVTNRHVFYNNSPAFDVDPIDPKGNDSAAIATDKEALLLGQTATFANYISYSRGINGIAIDVGKLSQTILIDRDDFTFRVGNDNAPENWPLAPEPESIRIEAGETVNEADRIFITWPDDSIRDEWIYITLHANDSTGLAAPDRFFFGNAIAETGNANDTQVNGSDFAGVRGNTKTFLDPADIENPHDFNRDELVNSVDLLLVRDHSTLIGTRLNLITPTIGGSLLAKPSAKVAFVPEQSVSDQQSDTVAEGKAEPIIATERDLADAVLYLIAQQRKTAGDDSLFELDESLDDLFAHLSEFLG